MPEELNAGFLAAAAGARCCYKVTEKHPRSRQRGLNERPPPAWGRNLEKQETPASCLASQCSSWQQGQSKGGQGTPDACWAPARGWMMCLARARGMSLAQKLRAARGCLGGARSPISFCFVATTAFPIPAKPKIQLSRGPAAAGCDLEGPRGP